MGTNEMGEMLLLGGGGRGSIISRSLRTEMPFSPSSLCPTPSPAGQSSGGHQDFIQRWHLQLETPPILCGQITKLLDFEFFPVCNRPLGTSPQNSFPSQWGEGADSSQPKRWAVLVQP